MAYLALGCRLVLLGVFLVALVSKVCDHREFEDSLVGVVPHHRVAAALTTATEAAVVVLLCVPRTGPAGLALAAALLVAFIVGITRALRRGTTAPCRCFGASATPLGVPHVVRNGVLVGVAAAGAFAGSALPTDLPGITITAVSAAVTTLAVVRLDDVVALFQPVTVR